MLELQRLLPRARFVYCSATGVSEVGWRWLHACGYAAMRRGACTGASTQRCDHQCEATCRCGGCSGHCAHTTTCLTTHHCFLTCPPFLEQVGNLAYMERLGLWGPGAAFSTFQSFLDSMKKRGIVSGGREEGQCKAAECCCAPGQLGSERHGLSSSTCIVLACTMTACPATCPFPACPHRQTFLEMLSMELKGDGLYVSRGLSFRCAALPHTFDSACQWSLSPRCKARVRLRVSCGRLR